MYGQRRSPERVAAALPNHSGAQPAGHVGSSAESYVVQLAAYKSLAGAEQRLADLRVPGCEIVRTPRYYVILAGRFGQREQARAAGEALKQDSGLDYWVREQRELQLAGALPGL